ncbi:MAG: lysylphosphatidylglycerol synthase transmembrane domain-containing protein [Candidatus Saccharimonadales bacterium]
MKWKIWLNILTIAALGIIIFVAWQDITEAFGRMRDLNLVILLLFIPAQFFVFFGLAKLFYHFFRATENGTRVSLRTLFPAMLELNFVNHVFPSGGVSGFSYLTLRLKAEGVSTAKSTLAHLARFAFTFIGYIGLLLVALLVLAIEGRTSSLVVLAVSAITFTILFGTGILVFVIGDKDRIAVFTKGLAKAVNKIIHIFRRKHPETIRLNKVEKTFLELHEDYCLMRTNFGKMRQVLVWAMIVNVAEIVLLYLVFVAHGVWINPGAVIVAFVIANTAGLIAVLPGGIGVYEPLMTAVLISGGVPAGLALSATLVYRVLALLLSLVTGYFLYQKVIHRADFIAAAEGKSSPIARRIQRSARGS